MLSPLPRTSAGIEVSRDLRTGEWALSGHGHACRLRPWTWGERRRLVESCTVPGGFDRARFVALLLGLLTDDPPPPEVEPLYAHAALDLLGVARGPRGPLVDAELVLARALGWGPRELNAQSAPEVDRMLAALVPKDEAGPTPPPGWHSIRVVNDDEAVGG